MAATGLPFLRRPLLYLIFVVVFSFCIGWTEAKSKPSKADIEEWARAVDKDLKNLNQIVVIVDKHYEEQRNKTKSYSGLQVAYEQIDSENLVKEMAASLAELLGRKMDALSKLVVAAERDASNYRWNDEIQKNDVEFINSKYLKDEELTYVNRFEKAVTYNFSSVHIPVEIYDGTNEILNGINWTSALDEQFRENARQDPEILWQYFGSQSGFMRTFPATSWPNKGVDLYDVRRQSWSGSTHGQSLQLMRNAVKSILDTLGENDFVNIVQFAEDASFVSTCFNHTPFVQANYRNKLQLERDVDTLSASGQADFSNALRFAFEKFEEFSANETNDEREIGAACNKVIMLLTDGGTDNAKDIFEEYNWKKNKSVRVFTYAVGPTPNPVHAIRWMACANKGYFSQIPAMGAIRARVQNYEMVLARPLALARSREMRWTSCEYSTFRDWDAKLNYTTLLSKSIEGSGQYEWEVTVHPVTPGLGMMTTVTLPVYSSSVTSTSQRSNQTILGVVGIDVTTAELESKTPYEKIGPNGYSFAINPNGYVVFHPNLKTTGKYMTEPPNVDILDLEIDDDNENLQELRRRMILRETDIQMIETLFLSPDRRYVTRDQADYAFTAIANTTFSLGLCVPIYQKEYYKFTGDFNLLDWRTALPDDESYKVFVAPWNYHKNQSESGNITELKHLIRLFESDTDTDNWNLDLLYHLNWDTKLLDEHFASFNSMVSSTTFVMTNGGLTYVHLSSESDFNFFEEQRDPRNSTLFTRAQHSTSCIIMSDVAAGNQSTPFVTVACAVSNTEVENGQLKAVDKPAVAGHRFKHDIILKELKKSVNDAAAVSGSDLYTCNDTNLNCYVLDNGGFLVTSSVEEHEAKIGHFIGEVDPQVFAMLYENESVLSKVEQYDFQSTCVKEKVQASAAGFSQIRVPSFNLLFDMLNIGWWSNQVTWAWASFSFYSWITPEVTVYAQEDEDDTEKCEKVFEQYYIKKTIETVEKTIQCKNSTRSLTVVKMPLLGSLFVVADPVVDQCDSEKYPSVSNAPRRLNESETEQIVCSMAQNPRMRKRSYDCYASDKNEDSSECGAVGLYLSKKVFAVVFIPLLLQLWSCFR